jgi:hypothetical protein
VRYRDEIISAYFAGERSRSLVRRGPSSPFDLGPAALWSVGPQIPQPIEARPPESNALLHGDLASPDYYSAPRLTRRQ